MSRPIPAEYREGFTQINATLRAVYAVVKDILAASRPGPNNRALVDRIFHLTTDGLV